MEDLPILNKLPPRKTSRENLVALHNRIIGIISEHESLFYNHTSGRIELHHTDIVEMKHQISQEFSNFDKLIAPVRTPEETGWERTIDGYILDDEIPF